jgi:hypothetical protein
MIAKIFQLLGKVLGMFICLAVVFVWNKGHQPMTVLEAPQGMTYFEFMQDRVDAAKKVEPARCGWGMMVSLAALGPIYSVVYTEVGINPDGKLAKMAAPDSNIPKGVEGAEWYEVPDIWWGVVERLSWTMLGKPTSIGCQFSAVR